MTNKEKTILFLKAFCILIWIGATVMSCASVLNGGADAFVKAAAVITIATNLGLAGIIAHKQIIK